MVALAGFSGLFVGVVITFCAWKAVYDKQAEKAKRIIKNLKWERDFYRLNSDRGHVEVIHRHEYATPEQVTDLHFGG